MNKKTAFKQVIAHQEATPLPYSVKFTVESHERMDAYMGRAFDPIADTGAYVVASHTNKGWQEVKPGYFRDYFGVVWNKTADKTLGVVDDPPLKTASFGGYTFPDPNSIPVYGFIEDNNAHWPDLFHMISIGFSLFERAWSLMGMEELLMAFYEEPEFVHDLLARITAYNVGVVENAARLGVDCLHLGDDWGSQNGPLISPDQWREFIREPFCQTCACAHKHGLLVSLHCCGNVAPLMEDIQACGVDVFDPFQPEAMDIWKLREQFRGRLAFWGGLSVQQTLPFGTPDDVRRETRRLIKNMAPGGGYILAPSHSITGDIPAENVMAFLDEVRGTCPAAG